MMFILTIAASDIDMFYDFEINMKDSTNLDTIDHIGDSGSSLQEHT